MWLQMHASHMSSINIYSDGVFVQSVLQNISISWPPIHLLHRIYQWDKTFCFLLLRTKCRNQAMLYGETLIELLNIAIGF